MKEIEIRKEPIELFKLLKLGSLVGTGGEAKILIDEGQVSVNGEVEHQKRKKLFAGDVVGFQNEEYKVSIGVRP